MRKTVLVLAFALTAVSVVPQVAEAKDGVGFGVAGGIVSPSGAFNVQPMWGFYVDIPLISTFNISPSALVYGLKADNVDVLSVTDMSLNFKFVVPLGGIKPFAGVTAGVTTTQDLDPHFGFLAGIALTLISNLDLFAQVNYRFIIEDAETLRNLQIFAGPIFRF